MYADIDIVLGGYGPDICMHVSCMFSRAVEECNGVRSFGFSVIRECVQHNPDSKGTDIPS